MVVSATVQARAEPDGWVDLISELAWLRYFGTRDGGTIHYYGSEKNLPQYDNSIPYILLYHKAEQNVTMLALRSPRFVRYQNSELADLPYITKQYLAHNWQRLPLHH